MLCITKHSDLLVELDDNVRRSPRPVGFILWASLMSAQNVIKIHPIAVESGPKWWADWLSDIAIHRATLAKKINKNLITMYQPIESQVFISILASKLSISLAL